MAVMIERDRRQALTGAYKLLEQHGEAEVVTVVRDRLRHEADMLPTVVAVGEVKRGKSTLVNALVGQRDLLPVGVDITTGAFVRVLPPTAQLPAGQATVVLSDNREVTVPAAELRDWVTVGGSRRRDGDAFVMRADVAHDPTHAPGMALVDTPGVGGLDVGHAQLAMRAARQASALLFVVDAGQPLTAPELQFLAESAAGVDVVVFAVTKTDKHPTSWREIVADNRALLAEHAPRFATAPIVGVAAPLALDAADATDEHLATALLERSGIQELGAALAEVAADARGLPVRNALRRVHTALLRVRDQVALKTAAAAQASGVEEGAVAERERLTALQEQKSRWTLDLERDLGRLRATAVERLQSELEGLRTRWTKRISDERLPFLKNVGEELAAALSSELVAAVGSVTDQYRRNLEELVARMFEHALTADDLLDRAALPHADLPVTQTPVTTKGIMDPSVLTTGLFGASWAGRLHLGPMASAGGGVFAMLGGWPAVAIGGAWLALNAGFRLVRTNRQRLLAWLNEVLVKAKSEVTTHLDTVAREIKPDLVVAFRTHLARRIAELNDVVKEADKAAGQSKQERAERVASLERHLQALDAQLDAIASALSDPEPGRTTATTAGTSDAPGTSN